jgi:FkbM family methyltransferase
MVLFVILGGALALLLALSFHAARTASSLARSNSQSLSRLEDKIAEWQRSMQLDLQAMGPARDPQAEARQFLELQAEIRALADLQTREFSRMRAMFDVLPNSVGALQRALGEIQESTIQLNTRLEASSATQGERLAEIRANMPAPKPAYEDPVPFIEAMSEPEVLRIAEALTFVRPLTPYPNWYFDVDWPNTDLGYRIRRSIWTYFNRRKTFAALDVPWYGGLKLRMYLGNDQSRQQFVAGCLDPNEFTLLDKLLAPGMVFLDAGANEGFYTVFASRRVGETGSVWAFEPSRREMDRLTANVRLNGLANVRSFCVALADEDTEAEFLVAGEEHSGHNTLGHFVYESGLNVRVCVPIRRLDSVLQESPLERLDFLKVDVEGAELRVLSGARDTLRKFRPYILLEMNDPSLKAQGGSRERLIQLLESHDYSLYLFDPATGLPVPAFEGRYGDNMLAVPVERNLPKAALLPLPVTGR